MNNQLTLDKFIVITFQCVSLLVSLICGYYNLLNGYDWLWCLPLTYFIVFTIFGYAVWLKDTYTNRLLLYLVNIACFLKYVITPLSMISQEYFSAWGSSYGMWGPTPVPSVMTKAIFMECGEVLFVYITYAFCMKKERRKQFNGALQNTQGIQLFRNRVIIYLFCAVSFVYILMVSPDTLSLKSLISVSEMSSSSETSSHPGITIVFKQILLISLMLLMMDWIYKRIKNEAAKISISYIILALYISLNMSYSRWDLLFALIAGSYVLYFYYGKAVLKYSMALGCIAIVGVFAISRVKFRYALDASSTTKALISMLFGQMQDYFSGPRLVAQSIEVRRMFKNEIGMGTIINDLFGNVPLISELFNQKNRINRYFCYYNFNRWDNATLLMPLLGEGYCYLPFFPWFLSIFYSALVFKIDRMAKQSKCLEIRYLCILEECWLAFALCLNSQTSWGHIIQVFIMTWLVFWMNSKVTIKRR